MEDSLARAISALLNPQSNSSLKVEAQTFCDQFKNSNDGWLSCANIFLQQSSSDLANKDPQTRFFALQTVEEFLRRKLQVKPTNQQIQQLRQIFWSYIDGSSSLNSNTTSPIGTPTSPIGTTNTQQKILSSDLPVYLRNKLSVIITLIFIELYPREWPSFFDNIISLLINSCGTPREHIMTDFFLRICLAIDDEVVNQLLVRNNEELQRNTTIKDAMREGDVSKLVNIWFQLLYSHSKIGTELIQTNFGRNEKNSEFAVVVLSLFAKYVSWIDIQLVIIESFVRSLYKFLETDEYREQACMCLIEIIGKGMNPDEKLALVKKINLIELLNMLISHVQETEDEIVAKLINAVGIEMCISFGNAEGSSLKNELFSVIQFDMNFLITCLSIDNLDFINILLPFLNEYLTVLKRYKKTDTNIPKEVIDISDRTLASLLQALIIKMKYDTNFSQEIILNSYGLGINSRATTSNSNVAAGLDGTDVEDPFIEIRKSLKRPLDNIASINTDLFINYVSTEVCNIYKRISENGIAKIDWSDAELALHLTYLFGECVKSKTGQILYILDGATTDGGISLTILTPLGKMLYHMIESSVSSYKHLSIPLSYFENIVRYATFCDLFPEVIPSVLMSFIDVRGLHYENRHVRYRLFYLFHKFIRIVRHKIGNLVEAVLTNINDLLAISSPSLDFIQSSYASNLLRGGSTTSLVAESEEKSAIEAQLYLFESVGCIVSCDSVPASKQAEYLTVILSPIMSAMESLLNKGIPNSTSNASTGNISNPEELINIFHLVRLINAVGALGKGFPDFEYASNIQKTINLDYINIFKSALSAIVSVLSQLNNYGLIRNAVRYTAQRLVGCMGQELLSQIGPLIRAGLLNNTSPSELIDLLPFIGLLQHRFKSTIFPVLVEIVGPILDRVFVTLNIVASGTDEQFELISLRKSYLGFVCQIFNSDMESVFIVENNISKLETILQSLLHFISDFNDQSVQKLASSALLKMINAWGGNAFSKEINNVIPPQQSQQYQSDKPYTQGGKLNIKLSGKDETSLLPGFDAFIYTKVVPLLFEIPLNKQFDPNDGQCIVVMNELIAIHRSIYLSQGDRYLQFLATEFFPNKIGLRDTSSIQHFIQNLQNNDTKQLRNKKIFIEFIHFLRQNVLK